ncbi:MAG: metalloregulator ArsR/SmtB family transcription factor [Spirochaetia bacterium]|nr:metalloregulator ArsR/SmtB family transcription factor [Spirochaetia bacterium]
MEKALEVFSALSDRTRLRIYRLLADIGRDVAVCEIIDSIEENQYNVSKHLRILKNAGLVKENKSGRWVFYCACGEASPAVSELVKGMKNSCFVQDSARLRKRLGLRKNGEVVSCCIARELMGSKSGKEKNR